MGSATRTMAAHRDGTTPNGTCAICGQRSTVTFHTLRPAFVIAACAHCVSTAQRNITERTPTP